MPAYSQDYNLKKIKNTVPFDPTKTKCEIFLASSASEL